MCMDRVYTCIYSIWLMLIDIQIYRHMYLYDTLQWLEFYWYDEGFVMSWCLWHSLPVGTVGSTCIPVLPIGSLEHETSWSDITKSAKSSFTEPEFLAALEVMVSSKKTLCQSFKLPHWPPSNREETRRCEPSHKYVQLPLIRTTSGIKNLMPIGTIGYGELADFCWTRWHGGIFMDLVLMANGEL